MLGGPRFGFVLCTSFTHHDHPTTTYATLRPRYPFMRIRDFWWVDVTGVVRNGGQIRYAHDFNDFSGTVVHNSANNAPSVFTAYPDAIVEVSAPQWFRARYVQVYDWGNAHIGLNSARSGTTPVDYVLSGLAYRLVDPSTPNATGQLYEPVLTSATSPTLITSTSNFGIRFTVPSGIDLNVLGVTINRPTVTGNPGPMRLVVYRGSSVVAQSDPFPSRPSSGFSIYIPILQGVLLERGQQYDFRFEVSGTHNGANRYEFQLMAISHLPFWWYYRVLEGSTVRSDVMPPVFYLYLDPMNPWG